MLVVVEVEVNQALVEMVVLVAEAKVRIQTHLSLPRLAELLTQEAVAEEELVALLQTMLAQQAAPVLYFSNTQYHSLQ
jgi:hypothetical protein